MSFNQNIWDALILLGGKGTRLNSISNGLPKSLMPVGEKVYLDLLNVAYVGNDINDKEAMKIVVTPFCPSDAHVTIKNISDHILNAKGGDGVIRELLDFIIKQKGKQSYGF